MSMRGVQASPSASRNAAASTSSSTTTTTTRAAPISGRRSSLTRSSPRSSVAARAAAPALNDVNDVGLKDAPLKSLFPEENPPPTKVSFIWNRGRGERTLLSSTERRKAS